MPTAPMAMTPADPRGVSVPASRASPAPPRMLLTAAIMAAAVNSISTGEARLPLVAMATARASLVPGGSKNCWASGTRVR